MQCRVSTSILLVNQHKKLTQQVFPYQIFNISLFLIRFWINHFYFPVQHYHIILLLTTYNMPSIFRRCYITFLSISIISYIHCFFPIYQFPYYLPPYKTITSSQINNCHQDWEVGRGRKHIKACGGNRGVICNELGNFSLPHQTYLLL